MKRVYISPKCESFETIRTSVLCASNNGEGMLDGKGGGHKEEGPNAAPKRRVF